MKISDCKVLELPRRLDVRGSLTFVEGGHHIPFDIKTCMTFPRQKVGALMRTGNFTNF